MTLLREFTDEFKDSRTRAVVMGILAPAIISAFALWNVISGEVLWLGSRHSWAESGTLFTVFHDSWRVWGTGLFKLGVSLGLFAWFGLANWNRTESWTEICGFTGIFAIVCGVVLAVIGWF